MGAGKAPAGKRIARQPITGHPRPARLRQANCPKKTHLDQEAAAPQALQALWGQARLQLAKESLVSRSSPPLSDKAQTRKLAAKNAPLYRSIKKRQQLTPYWRCGGQAKPQVQKSRLTIRTTESQTACGMRPVCRARSRLAAIMKIPGAGGTSTCSLTTSAQ